MFLNCWADKGRQHLKKKIWSPGKTLAISVSRNQENLNNFSKLYVFNVLIKNGVFSQ